MIVVNVIQSTSTDELYFMSRIEVKYWKKDLILLVILSSVWKTLSYLHLPLAQRQDIKYGHTLSTISTLVGLHIGDYFHLGGH